MTDLVDHSRSTALKPLTYLRSLKTVTLAEKPVKPVFYEKKKNFYFQPLICAVSHSEKGIVLVCNYSNYLCLQLIKQQTETTGDPAVKKRRKQKVN